MRSTLLVVGLLSTIQGVAAQTTVSRQDAPALPDSTYLALTLELPVHGTFHVTRHRINQAGLLRPVGVRVRNDYYIDRVEIAGCRMIMYHRSGGNPATATKTDLPLKQIALENLKVQRVAGSTEETPPWAINGRAIDRSDRPFTHSRRNYATVRATNEFDITLVDRDQADRFVRLLKDAATRCESWNTSPISPIR